MPGAYKTYSEYLAEKFPGKGKIQKIGVTIGNSCPNRDGTIGRGGCSYCNNASFTPEYIDSTATPESIQETLEKGKSFFGRKYPDMRFLAYFQSYTNTYGGSTEQLMKCYRTAAASSGIVGIVIGTRPDCIAEDLMHELARMNAVECPVMIELGAESSHDITLERVNRCHSWETTVNTVYRLNAHGISVGLHFIMGLPGETRTMMLDTVRRAVNLPIDTLKFHQLQIIKGTRFAAEYEENPNQFELFNPETYADLCREIIDIVAPSGIAIERFVSQAPDDMLIAPRWGLKNYQFTNLLNSRINK